MAPEQLEGKSHASLIGAILKDEPAPMTAVQPLAPPSLERLVRTCLAKDPDERWQNAHDVAAELKWIAQGPLTTSKPGTPRRASSIWLAAIVAALGAGFAVGRLAPRPKAVGQPLVRFTVPLPPGARLDMGYFPVALSPDGRLLVFSAHGGGVTRLYLRALDGAETTEIPGTEGGLEPFVSPDSRWLGFFAQGKLKKMSLAGGAPMSLCDAPEPRGGSWSEDDTIVFVPGMGQGLMRVSAAGGVPRTVTTPDRVQGERFHFWPQLLPGGQAAIPGAPTGVREDLALSPDGRQVAFEEKEELWVFDIGRGTKSRLSSGARAVDPVWARDGKGLAFTSEKEGPWNLFWKDLGHGSEERLVSSPLVQQPSDVSPDGRTLVFGEQNPVTNWDVCMLSLSGDRQPRPLVKTPFNEYGARFSRDGRFLAYQSDESGRPEVYVRRFPDTGARWVRLGDPSERTRLEVVLNWPEAETSRRGRRQHAMTRQRTPATVCRQRCVTRHRPGEAQRAPES